MRYPHSETIFASDGQLCWNKLYQIVILKNHLISDYIIVFANYYSFDWENYTQIHGIVLRMNIIGETLRSKMWFYDNDTKHKGNVITVGKL